MYNILITGAYGFIGKHLSLHLTKLGHEVTGIGHGKWSNNEAKKWGVKNWFNNDVNIINLQKIYSRKKPDIIFHLAGGSTVSKAILNPEEDFFKNVTSANELLEWVRFECPTTRIIATSSAAVYGSGYDNPISEDSICSPCSVYGKHKEEMESLFYLYNKNYNIDFKIVRLFSVYGPELKKQLLWELCIRLMKKESPLLLGGTGQELRDWTYIDDVVNALSVIGLDKKKILKKFVINVGTGVGVSVKKITNTILDKWFDGESINKKPIIKFSGKKRQGDPINLVADTSLLLKLNYSCKIKMSDGINFYINWFKKLNG